MSEKLAIHGGRPVREKALDRIFPGASIIGEEEKKEVLDVIESQSLFRYYGKNLLAKVDSFENSFMEKIGTKHALGVSSGTASLVVALKALGIGPGHHVLVPSCTFIASAGAVICAGAIPVFVDIDESFTLDPDDIERRITKRTKAIMTVAWRGNPCRMDEIMQIAKKHNLFVIEDVAQSLGCSYKGKKLGNYGDVGCFSLQLNKLITTGDGGVVVTNDDKTYERAVRYHDHGMFREKEGFLATSNESDVIVGQNYRMNELTGAVALAQLRKLDLIINNLRKYIFRIREEIRDINGISLMRINDEEGFAGNTVVMMLPSSVMVDDFVKAINAEGIPAQNIYNGRPVYMFPQIYNKRTTDDNNFPFIPAYCEEVEYHSGLCPKAEDFIKRNVAIDIGPAYGEDEVNDIIKAIKKVSGFLL